MRIEIDHDSSVPPYEQLRKQIALQIRSGELAVGTRLPTVRALAVDLALAANTVARAYRELELANLVVTKGRSGTFVHTRDASLQRVHAAADAYAKVVRDAGLDIEEGVRIVRASFESTSTSG